MNTSNFSAFLLLCLLLQLQALDALDVIAGCADSAAVVRLDGVCDLGQRARLLIGLPRHTETLSTCAQQVSEGQRPQGLVRGTTCTDRFQRSLTESEDCDQHSDDQQLVHRVPGVCEERESGDVSILPRFIHQGETLSHSSSTRMKLMTDDFNCQCMNSTSMKILFC